MTASDGAQPIGVRNSVTPYRDPFSGHVIITAAPDTPVDPEGPESVGDEAEAEPTREYTAEEEAVNRCIAGLRRWRSK